MKKSTAGTLFTILLAVLFLVSCNDTPRIPRKTVNVDGIECIRASKDYRVKDTSRYTVLVTDCQSNSFSLEFKISNSDGMPFNAEYGWYATEDGIYTQIPGQTAGIFNGSLSEVSKNSYVCIAQTADANYVSDVFTVYNSGLPVVEITSDTNLWEINRDDYVDARIVIKSPDGNDLDSDVTIKGRGNYSWELPKKGYNLKFDSKTAVLGMEKGKKWCLIANYDDGTFMRNYLASFIAHNILDGEAWIPTYKFVELVYNGEFLGNYTLVEAVKVDKKRLNIDSIEDLLEDFIDADTGDGAFIAEAIATGDVDLSEAGFLLEADFRIDAQHAFFSSLSIPFCLKDPDFEDLTREQARPIVGFIQAKVNDLETAITDESFKTKTLDEIGELIDLPSFIDWYLIEELYKNLDANFYTSVYVYFDAKDNLWHMGPDWDFDHSAGNVRRGSNLCDCADTDGLWVVANNDDGWTSWHFYLLKNPDFRQAVIDRFESVKDTLLDSLKEEAERTREYLQLSAELEAAIWPEKFSHFSPNIKNYAANVAYFLSWIETRAQKLVPAIEKQFASHF